MMQIRWRQLPQPSPETVQSLQSLLGISPVLCQLLAQRNIGTFDEAKHFFRPSLKQLHDPFLMKDMDNAVARIEKAIQNHERILIYGDYDVDGTTAVSLVYSFLKDHYQNLDTYIPDRYKEGYGISTSGIDYAEDNEISLIIALDCGIKAIDKVRYAADKKIDFIICDHHRPGNEIPKAIAVLDPKRPDCNYPYDELSGCGIGFKLVQALCKKWNLPDETWHNLLDLLAISIGSDIVPITGENRILAFYGLKKINSQPRIGLALLKESGGKKDKPMTITDVVFIIGPRINAAGRISHGRLAVELLTEENHQRTEELSQIINDHNTERKELDSSITTSALGMIEEQNLLDRHTTVLFHESWHKGVIGIVASRLIETYYRPTIVFTESKGFLAGSARSVKGFDVYNALDQCSDVLEQFGGHMYAAGMTLRKERFETFRDKFEEVVKHSIKPEQLIPEIEIDAKVMLSDLTPAFFKILKQFAPFGPQNMAPVFQTDNLIDSGFSRAVGQDKSHLRVSVREPSSGIILNGIAFKMAEEKLPLLQSGKPVSIVYHLEENEYNGQVSLQLRVKDIRLTEELVDQFTAAI